MKLLFVHSGEKLKEDKAGNYYTDGSYSKKVWDRYLNLCDELTVIFRKDEKIHEVEEATKLFNVFDKIKMQFVEIVDRNKSILAYLDYRKVLLNKKIIKDEVLKSDFVIARLPSDAGNYAVKFARKYKKPYFIELVGCPWDALWNHSLKGKLLAPFIYLQTKSIVKDCKYGIYVTNEFLQKRYPMKGYSIGLSDVEVITAEEIVKNRINKLNKLKSNQVISVATLGAVNVKYKKFDTVIKALTILNKDKIKYKYYVAGNGDKNWIQSVIKKYNAGNYVEILKPMPHEKVYEFLDDIDIYIQPSKQEGLPRALVEAMSRGCPCIGSNAGGIPELLDKKYIFKKGNTKELIKILQNFSKNDMLIQAKRNFQKSKEYGKDVLDKKRNEFYKKFIYQNILED